jgi:hypothetical protein
VAINYDLPVGKPSIKLQDFYEGWEVDASGRIYLGYKKQGWFRQGQWMDWFTAPKWDKNYWNGKGRYMATGYAQFEPGYNMLWSTPGTDAAGKPLQSGGLPSSTVAPLGWTDKGAVKHELIVDFNYLPAGHYLADSAAFHWSDPFFVGY